VWTAEGAEIRAGAEFTNGMQTSAVDRMLRHCRS
jgi:hypothetical protein